MLQRTSLLSQENGRIDITQAKKTFIMFGFFFPDGPLLIELDTLLTVIFARFTFAGINEGWCLTYYLARDRVVVVVVGLRLPLAVSLVV